MDVPGTTYTYLYYGTAAKQQSELRAPPNAEMDIGSGCGGRSGHDGKVKRKRSREEASANCPRPSAAVDALATIRAVYGSTDDTGVRSIIIKPIVPGNPALVLYSVSPAKP